MIINYLCRLKSNLKALQLGSFRSRISAINTVSISKEETVITFLKNCSCMKDLKQIHARVIQLGFEQNRFVVGKVIVFCAAAEHGDMNYAVSVFEKIGDPDAFIFNTMIRGFGKANDPRKAFDYYKRMQERGLVSDSFTFSFLLKVCGRLGLVLLGRLIHCSTLKRGLNSHVFVRNTLVHMYGSFKEIEASRQLFEEIPNPELVAWNIIIDCHVSCGKFNEALDMFSRMLKFGKEPDEATFVVILSACSALGALDFGRWVHSCISNIGHGWTTEVNNSLLDMLHGNVELGKQVRKQLLELEPDHSSDYVLLANTYASAGRWNEAMRVRKTMRKRGVQKPEPGNSVVGRHPSLSSYKRKQCSLALAPEFFWEDVDVWWFN
ncbi:hypothetical protein D5086_027980 [Populus alba]|uniref:Uncharacterized protein n=1 Tax=Populus alba TaxID=43335 RepID=A0ACC4AWZ7_POPAL